MPLSGSKRLKGYTEVLHHIVKSKRLLIKVTTFRNDKKKDWFSHEIRLVFVHGEIFKDRSRNSAAIKMELFATIGSGKKL